MIDKRALQQELEEILEKVRPEERLLSDATIKLIIDHNGYEFSYKTAEVLDDKYRERYFPIMFYQKIEGHKKREKEIIIRHELIHIRDMVNPCFDYSSNAEWMKSIEEEPRTTEYFKNVFLKNIVRHYLFDISIVMRLKKEKNFDDFVKIEDRRKSFLLHENLQNYTDGGKYKPNYDMDEALKSMKHPVEQLINEKPLTLPDMREIAKRQIDCFEKGDPKNGL